MSQPDNTQVVCLSGRQTRHVRIVATLIGASVCGVVLLRAFQASTLHPQVDAVQRFAVLLPSALAALGFGMVSAWLSFILVGGGLLLLNRFRSKAN